jgi:CRP-like cAMP-binding protein
MDMDYSLLLDNIARHITLTEGEQGRFISILQPKKIKKKQYLLREHEVCKHSAFVLGGCLRGYTIDDNGFEHILQFAPRDWWIADMYSLITQEPGNLNIDALEDTEVLLLPKTEQERLFIDIPKFERFFRIITEKSLVTNRQRILDNLSLTAHERYDNFCTRYPTLIHTLPQKQIAAYIGVTPEFLSKMRGGLYKAK